METLWTALPEAAELLADCAAIPPAKRSRGYRFGERAEQYDRTDMRVRILHRLHQEAFAEQLAAYDAAQTPERLAAVKGCPSVEQAIDAAISAHLPRAA